MGYFMVFFHMGSGWLPLGSSIGTPGQIFAASSSICDAYGDAAMFGEGAVAKPPPEELEANDEVGKLRAYYSARKAGKTWDAPATVDFLND